MKVLYHLKYSILLFLLFTFTNTVYAQHACLIYPLSLSEKVSNSSLIVEGEITDIQSFRDKDNNIYTAHTINIWKIFSGETNDQNIILITEGGLLDNEYHLYSSSPELHKGSMGIFFCHKQSFSDKTLKSGLPAYTIYGGTQGHISFDENLQKATDPFQSWSSIEKELYRDLLNITGKGYKTLHKKKAEQINDKDINFIPVITGFSPSSVSAGTGEILTVRGSGFGALRGAGFVEFKNANNGGNTYVKPLVSDYIYWSDTEIRVKVPSATSPAGCAGSGNIKVTTTTGASAISINLLSVVYAYTNINSNEIARIPVLSNIDAKGGYTFRLNRDFESSPAKDAFYRAFISWRCNTSVNFKIGETTDNNTSEGDKENVVRFTQPEELPAGVLGRCITRLSACLANNWYISEIDLEFSPDANWHFDETPVPSNKIDFESVALHELGHAHLLSHIIKPEATMHFSISHGQNKRIPGEENDIGGGLFVMEKSKEERICGPSVMSALQNQDCADPDGPHDYINPAGPNKETILLFYNYDTEELNVIIQNIEIKDAFLIVSNTQGQIMQNLRVNTTDGSFTASLDLHGWPRGLFICTLITKNKKNHCKFIRF